MDDIAVIENSPKPDENPVFTSVFSHRRHPYYSSPTFFRHNHLPVHLTDIYHGETCYLIGRGPSLGKFMENAEIKDLLLHPAIIKYGMNSSPEVLNYNCQLWSGVDRMNKFPKQIFKSPGILKMVPSNRFYQRGFHPLTGRDNQEFIAYDRCYISHCPNTIGVYSYLLNDDTKGRISFANSFFSSSQILYGYYKSFKSVMLFALRVAIELGFKKIVLVGVDFKMDTNLPYYKESIEKYSKFHVDHNNSLYQWLAPTINEIYTLLTMKVEGFTSELLTASPIAMMPFIPVIDLKKTLSDEIKQKMGS
jgi:hypothetical protein